MRELEAFLKAVKKSHMYGDSYLLLCTVEKSCSHKNYNGILADRFSNQGNTPTYPCYHNRSKPGNVVRNEDSLPPCAAALKARGPENCWLKSRKSKQHDNYKAWVVLE
jgi:hypothetical protein